MTLRQKSNWFSEFSRIKIAIKPEWKSALQDNENPRIERKEEIENTQNIVINENSITVSLEMKTVHKFKFKSLYYHVMYPVGIPSCCNCWEDRLGCTYEWSLIFKKLSRCYQSAKCVDFHW